MCTSARAGKCILLLCSTIALMMSIVASYLSIPQGLENGRKIGLYEKLNTSLSFSQRGAYTNSTFTPIGWGFNAWIVIYVYQLIMLAHCWSTLCRRAPDRGLLCCDPDLSPAGLLFWHFIASLLNLTWIFLADRVDQFHYLLIPQVCVMFALALSLMASLISSYYWLWAGRGHLAENQCTYWLVVIMVQNCISLYAGWALFASFLNLDITLSLVTNLGNDTASFVSLAILIALTAAYVVAELTTLDHWLRFVFTPHIVLAWAAGTAIGNNFTGWTITNILLLLLICIVGLGLVLKLIAACVRTCIDPIFPGNMYSLKTPA